MIDPSPFWGVIAIVVLVCLSLASLPIGAAMGVAGLIFATLFYGGLPGLTLGGITLWSNAFSFSLTMIPLFVLMGEIIGRCELGKDTFDAVYMWMGKLKGGLAIVETISCAIFGAITGSTAATIVTIGGVAIPEMKRYGYSKEIRTGSIAVAGILANLIPPSLMAIFFCTLTEVSIGKVFIAGIVPGILLTIMFSVTVYVWVTIKPEIAPRQKGEESFTLKEKILALKMPMPIVLIFVLMITGIYLGIFSPTEAAGVGVALAVVTTMAFRRLTWDRFKGAVMNSVRTTAFIMVIIFGAMLFAHMMAVSRLPQSVAEAVVAFNIPTQGTIFLIIIVFLFFGCVMDVFGLMVLFVPIFFPAILALGYDAVWFANIIVVLVEIALITPPIAGNLYTAVMVDPDASVIDVAKGVLPFYICAILMVVLLVLFPQISLWLPNMMY